jgi:hypothetical protein
VRRWWWWWCWCELLNFARNCWNSGRDELSFSAHIISEREESSPEMTSRQNCRNKIGKIFSTDNKRIAMQFLHFSFCVIKQSRVVESVERRDTKRRSTSCCLCVVSEVQCKCAQSWLCLFVVGLVIFVRLFDHDVCLGLKVELKLFVVKTLSVYECSFL